MIALAGCPGSTRDDAPKAEAKAAPEAKAVAEAKAAPVPETADVPPPVPGPPPLEFEAEDGRYGYRDAGGKVVIPARFEVAMPFVDQVAGVATDEGWVFIDRTGRTLAKAFVFDNTADELVEERARIVADDRYGFITAAGRIVVPPTWSFVEPFSGGHAAVCEGCVREQVGEHFMMTGGTWGYVDASGKLVIPPRFSKAGPFVDGRAEVTEGGRSFVIGPDGNERP